MGENGPEMSQNEQAKEDAKMKQDAVDERRNT
jgi:hypothetical protein